jgi:hypothetical protein
VPANPHFSPHRAHDAVAIDQERGATKQLDLPGPDPDRPKRAERVRGHTLGIGEQRVFDPQPARPRAIAFDRVGVDAGECHSGRAIFVVVFAKLAKLAYSDGRSVQDVAEEHERLLADELSHRERLAALIGESQVGERLIEEILGTKLAAHDEAHYVCTLAREQRAPGKERERERRDTRFARAKRPARA